MYAENTLYFVALSMIPGIGPLLARQLISYVGSAEGIFKEKPQNLAKIPKIGEGLAHEIATANTLHQAERELQFCEKNHIRIFLFSDEEYPYRLKNCEDAPLFFFAKGSVDFNAPKIVSIVGTRNVTDYGKQLCKDFVEKIAVHNPIIVSGLAFGVDICAHKAALDVGLHTIAVLPTQFTQVTPPQHIDYVQKIVQQGAAITEIHTQQKYDAGLYVRRNRIIAGLSDVTIVVESKKKGGALITAEFANQYNREVCTFPGNVGNKTSEGCNALIKHNKATLIEHAADVERLLNWDKKKKPVQRQMFVDLTAEEKRIVELLTTYKKLPIDTLAEETNIPMNKISPLLLNLEFAGIITALPGKQYAIHN
ncbi:MAG: DNA-processing protein DprA [Bacteroidales bacterium]|jgi:DNA processing protein|nr:DNA-processing protein DprA [Bacteroidales bacterium]